MESKKQIWEEHCHCFQTKPTKNFYCHYRNRNALLSFLVKIRPEVIAYVYHCYCSHGKLYTNFSRSLPTFSDTFVLQQHAAFLILLLRKRKKATTVINYVISCFSFVRESWVRVFGRCHIDFL